MALFILFMLGVVLWEDPKYNDVVPYPDWAHTVGWVLVGLSAIQVPLWALIMSFYYLVKGRLKQVIVNIKWLSIDIVLIN